MEFLKPLVAVARKVLRTETKDNVNKSNRSDNASETFKLFYLSNFYSSRAGSTSKSKVPNRRHSLRPFDLCVKKRFGTTEGVLLLIQEF